MSRGPEGLDNVQRSRGTRQCPGVQEHYIMSRGPGALDNVQGSRGTRQCPEVQGH